MNPLPKVEPVTVPQTIIEAVQARYQIDSKRMFKAVAILANGELYPLPNGNYAAVSHTASAPVIYQVNPKYKSCTCKDGSNIVSHDGALLRAANLCKHYAAYLLLRELAVGQPVRRTYAELLAWAPVEMAKQDAISTGESRVALIQREINQ